MHLISLLTDSPLKNQHKALKAIENQIVTYEKFSPIVYKFARSVGFFVNPYELLTSDYLIEHDINETLKPIFQEHSTGSCISKSFTIRKSWSQFFGIPVPYWYTWSHAKASECIFELLHHYARLRVVSKIVELHFLEHRPQHIKLGIDS